MRDLIIIVLILAAGYFFYNKNSSKTICITADDVGKKFLQLMKHIETSSGTLDIATDPQKLLSLEQKINSLNLENLGNSNDFQAKCDAMDELMDEI